MTHNEPARVAMTTVESLLSENEQSVPISTTERTRSESTSNSMKKVVLFLRAQYKMLILIGLAIMWLLEYIRSNIFDILSNEEQYERIMQLFHGNKTE